MAEDKMMLAKSTFAVLCNTLEHQDWHYRKDEEKLMIECSARGDDLPMNLNVVVDSERMLVILISHLPYVIKEDKRIDAAIAVSAINDKLVNGCFDYNVATGDLFFRMSNSFIDSELGEDVFEYMLYCSCQTIDEYNDKLLMISTGMMTLEAFLNAESN